MSNVSTTKLSSKAQVVIPEDIRKKLNDRKIDPGGQDAYRRRGNDRPLPPKRNR